MLRSPITMSRLDTSVQSEYDSSLLQTDDMIEQLASLLLPIDALLAHEDYNPHFSAAEGLVSLFRNMWFLCVLFHFSTAEDKDESAMDWRKPALARIARKTPPMVLEEAHDSVASEVEYNTVIRQEFTQTVSSPIVSAVRCSSFEHR
jgi:phosphatidylinositol 4-kinase